MNSDGESNHPRRLRKDVAAVEEAASSLGVRVRERYGLVLGLLLVGYLLSGIDPDGWIAVVNGLIWVVVLLTALWAPGIPNRLRRIGLTATVLALLILVGLELGPSATTRAAGLFMLAIAQLAALVAVVVRISTHREVTLQTVMGGVSAYALIAIVMASVFFAAEILSDGTFLNGVVAQGDYTYFSFVTLTTVGFGDILAASDMAKRLVVIEAFVGQVFIITLVARLVSLWGSRDPTGSRPISNGEERIIHCE